MHFLRRICIVLSITTLVDVPVFAHAQDSKPRVIRFGDGLNENRNQSRAAAAFAEKVEKASGGKMRVQTIDAAALG